MTHHWEGCYRPCLLQQTRNLKWGWINLLIAWDSTHTLPSCSSESQEKVLFFLYMAKTISFFFFGGGGLLYNRISIYPHLLLVYLLHIQHLLVHHSMTLLTQMWFHYEPQIINSYSIHCKFVRKVMNTTTPTMESDKLFMNSRKAYILHLPTIQCKLIQWRMHGCYLSPFEENCVLGCELM